MGKLAVAGYAILVINVVGALLQPGREYLLSLCCVAIHPRNPISRRVSFTDDTKLSSPASPAKSARKITSGSYEETDADVHPKKLS